MAYLIAHREAFYTAISVHNKLIDVHSMVSEGHYGIMNQICKKVVI